MRVDFEAAAGKTLGDIDFPWDNGSNVDLVVDNLHVYSNDGGVHDIAPDRDGIRGVVEGTRFASLGMADDAKFFADRSRAWTNLFDAASGFLRAKDSAGAWREPFDPYDLFPVNPKDGRRTYNLDYCEGNAWHWNWHQMHDPDLLVALHGGREKAVGKLQTLFDADPYRGNSGGDGNENGLVGQYCHGNEPCHHVIYYFTLMGRRDLAARYIKEVADTLYGADFYGICGNEDCGQMSAWYVFSAIVSSPW